MGSFVGDWTITGWLPGHEIPTEGIPENAFTVGGILTITQTDANPDQFTLRWFDQNGNPVSAPGLQPVLDSSPPMLAGLDVSVMFGTKSLSCDVTVNLTSEKTLQGFLGLAGSSASTDKQGPEVGSGTFTADANNPPPPEEDDERHRRHRHHH